MNLDPESDDYLYALAKYGQASVAMSRYMGAQQAVLAHVGSDAIAIFHVMQMVELFGAPLRADFEEAFHQANKDMSNAHATRAEQILTVN